MSISPVDLTTFNIPDINIVQRLQDATCGDTYEGNYVFGSNKRPGLTFINTKVEPPTQFYFELKLHGTVEQVYFIEQLNILITLQKNKIEVYTIGQPITSIASTESINRVNQEKRFHDLNFDLICPLVYKDSVLIACYEDKKRAVSIGLINSQGNIKAITRVHTSDSKVQGMIFLGKDLLMSCEEKIVVARFFENAVFLQEQKLPKKCIKNKVMKIDLVQCLVICDGDAYYCSSSKICKLKISNVIFAAFVSPILYLINTTDSISYYVIPLDNSISMVPEIVKQVTLEGYTNSHQFAPIFINPQKQQGLFFKPKEDWFFYAFSKFYFEAALKFSDKFPTLINKDKEGLIKITRFCYSCIRIGNFYTNPECRNIDFLSETFYQLQQSNIPVKIILGVLVYTIIKDFFSEFFKHFEKWFSESEWVNDLSELPKESATKLARIRMFNSIKEATENGKKKMNVSQEVEKEFLTDLSSLLYQNNKTFFDLDTNEEDIDFSTKIPKNKEDYMIFLTSFLLILHRVNPTHEYIKEIVKQTDYLISDVVINGISGMMLIEYYINMNYLDGIFNIPNISTELKLKALSAVAIDLSLTDSADSNVINFDRKVELYLKEILEKNKSKTYDEINNILGKDVFQIFGGRKMKSTVAICIKHIKTWVLHDVFEYKNELRLRLCVLFLRTLYEELLKHKSSDLNLDWLTERIILSYLEYFEFVASEPTLPQVPDQFVSYCSRLIFTTQTSAKKCFADKKDQLQQVYYKIRCSLTFLDNDEETHDELMYLILNAEYPSKKLVREGEQQDQKYVTLVNTIITKTKRELIAFLKNSLKDQIIDEKNYKFKLVENLDILRKKYKDCKTCPDCLQLGIPCEKHNDSYFPFVDKNLTSLYSETIIFSLLAFENEKYNEVCQTLSKNCGRVVPDVIVSFFLSLCHHQLLKIGTDLEQGVKNIVSFVEEAYKDEPDGIEYSRSCLKTVYVPLIKYLKAYYDQNTSSDYMFLIECYLEYSKLPGEDELNATEELISAMSINTYAERITKTHGLSWRLQCRVKHHISLIDGLEEYFGAFVNQLLTVDEKKYITAFIDDLYEFLNAINPKIANSFQNNTNQEKYITLIRQHHRPFLSGRKNILSEIVLHCVCLEDANGKSPLLNVFIAKLFTQKAYAPAIALEVFIRFFPIIPLKNTKTQRDWINNNNNAQAQTGDNLNIFSLIFDSLQSSESLILLLPSIRYYSQLFSHLSVVDSAQRALFNNLNKRGFTITYTNKCKACQTKITSRETSIVKNGEFYHERCLHP
ncbi:hypothetical protein EDI_349420 [Entamoeba dispar SAW760]|uniref:Uncharacterized protein n=1 Tax=Entamoeba dispar (strain ATCC PRA-260 / SAW760) TaxID=370354 RepID=B0E7I5_ENTDS|nr:uncharacterized protein EDI_349420 [Entamoeba dispar SAW760]EDR29513.1 hypothetical protein EDI_349420 [Entamoeba dispar SAW760]|eukprot:EDR29513.1 hypothetical protein EDI_349420 [Entamoeba dispar SAW760]